jgi:hypothetical protein
MAFSIIKKGYTQAYDALSQIADGSISAVTKTASIIRSLISLGDDEAPAFANDIEEQAKARQARKQKQVDQVWTNSPEQVRRKQRILSAVNELLAKSQSDGDWISEAYLRDYGILPPFTQNEKIEYSKRGNCILSQEALHNRLYRMDPATGDIYDRATHKLVPRRDADADDFKQ